MYFIFIVYFILTKHFLKNLPKGLFSFKIFPDKKKTLLQLAEKNHLLELLFLCSYIETSVTSGLKYLFRIIKSHSCWVWKGPLEVILSKQHGKAGPSRVSCPGQCPDSFGIFPRKESPQPPWAICASVFHPHSEKECLLNT